MLGKIYKSTICYRSNETNPVGTYDESGGRGLPGIW